MDQRPPWNPQRAGEIVSSLQAQEGALLPILHALQDEFGFLHADATEMVAHALNLSRAEVHGVISFYHHFRSAPPARLVVKVCRAEACQAAGGREAAAMLLDKLDLDWSCADPLGAVMVEPVYCLGLCAAGPAAMIGDKLLAGFDGAELVAAIRAAQ